MKNRRGQTLVLFALTLVLLVLMVCITLSIGAKTKRKLELQTVAETAAYSNAIATARTYNTASLLNRTMVSHWVAMAGVHGLSAWISEMNLASGRMAGLVREMGTYDPGLAAGCSGDSGMGGRPGWYDCDAAYPGGGCVDTAIRDASYELWHIGLALWAPIGRSPTPGDDVNGNCVAGVCSTHRPWVVPGFGNLDRKVGEQAKDIHETILNLGRISERTFEKLEDDLARASLTRRLLNASQGRGHSDRGAPRHYQVEGRANGKQQALREVQGASSLRVMSTHEQVIAEAIMGSRGGAFIINGEVNGQLVMPRRFRQEIVRVEAWLDANYNDAFDFAYRPPITAAFPSKDRTDPPEDRIHPIVVADRDKIGMGSMLGLTRPANYAARNQFRVTFRPSRIGCGGGRMVHTGSGSAWLQSGSAKDGTHHNSGHGPETAQHNRWPMTNPDGSQFTTCHAYHTHYGEQDDQQLHRLEDPDYRANTLLPGLGFIFPSSGRDGAGGVWGQPKIPVMLAYRNTRRNAEPWDLTVDFNFDRESDDARLTLGRSRGMDNDTLGLASGMAYYHRRGVWEEAPNMLNPFWRATLVPIGVDERVRRQRARAGEDPTPGPRRREQNVREMLRDNGHREFAEVYDGLNRIGFEGLR